MVKVKEKKTEPKKKGPAPKMPKAIKGENKHETDANDAITGMPLDICILNR